tara:strand:+ start:9036 stop:10127 length:1092 start_codon:yes stop_codon:yes gene_type:complete
MKKNIFIVASGTGGHVVPAKTIAMKLIRQNYLVTWIGTLHGIENKIVNDKHINFKYLKSSGIRGKSFLHTINGIINLIISFFQSLVYILKDKPIFILGFGGYISVPVSIAAFLMRVPVYVHESNSIAGSANKINNIFSKTTFQTFPGTFPTSKKIILSGNPIEDSFSKITQPEIKYKTRSETLNLLIFGGSQGAKFFNHNIPSCLNHFGSKFNVIHITGNQDRNLVEKIYNNSHMKAQVIEFSHEIDKLYDWSDIVISRSGSMTVSEICRANRAAILIPFIYATDNHQYANAKFLENSDVAKIVEENDDFSLELNKSLTEMYNNQEILLRMSNNSKNLFPHDSSAIILRNIPELNEKFDNTTS